MNKRMKYYSVVWLIALVIFNVIAFVTPNEIAGVSKFSGGFWVGYAFITLAFIGQLACALIALKEENNQKLFYNISIISVSYIGLIVMLVVGTLTMMIPALPYWVGVIVCLIVLTFTAVSVIKASAAIEEVERMDHKVKEQTFSIKSLAVDSEALAAEAKIPELKTEAKKVYEAIRYSDPMSNPALSDLEAQIFDKFNEFSSAVKSENAENAKTAAGELMTLIQNRNKKCKLLK